MAKGDDGNIRAWRPKKTDAAAPVGRRDGGARLASNVRDGNTKEWTPRPGAGAGALKPREPRASAPLAVAKSATPPDVAAAVPCVGCKGSQIKLAPNTKANLRASLLGAIEMAKVFLLGLFDSALVEADSAAPANVGPVSAHGPWEAAGFRVSEQGAAIIIGSVIGNSPAGQAGLEPNDTIAAIEDNGRPTNLALFAAGWAKGDKFSEHRILVERNGSQLALDITTS